MKTKLTIIFLFIAMCVCLHSLDLTKKKRMLVVKTSSADITEAVSNGENVFGFVGYIEMTKTEAGLSVPVNFTDSIIIAKKEVTELDSSIVFNEATMTESTTYFWKTTYVDNIIGMDSSGSNIYEYRQKTWLEYANGCGRWSIDNEYVLLPVGVRGNNGCRNGHLTCEEFNDYLNEFGISKLIYINDAKNLVASSKYTNGEQE